MENLKNAHKCARKDKTYYKEVKMVDSNTDLYLGKIQKMLIENKYFVSEYKVSTINDKGKNRTLMKLPYFPDRIIQWAILLQIEETFLATLCDHTCASLPGRGIKKASTLTTKYMKDEEGCKYCLKIDVTHFYQNINHNILKKMLRKKLKDKQLLELLDSIIDSVNGDVGIPIGSYLSQYFANFYLSYFDHWLKEEKRIRYVVRYMDDVIIFGNSKSDLHKLKNDIDAYLYENLKLTVKKNWQVFPTNVRGIDFVGFRHFFGYKLLRKSTCKNFKKRMILIKRKGEKGTRLSYSEWCSANSYMGWLKWCDSYRLSEKYLKPIQPYLFKYFINEVNKTRKVKHD